jgi:hypothetical protein
MNPTTPLVGAVLNRRAIRALVPAALAVACVIAVSAPAAASDSATSRQIDTTEGINRSTNSVTTRAGVVMTGVTFVDDKDVAGFRQQHRTSGSTLAAATPEWHCMTEWHFIHGGGANTYWKPKTGSRYLAAIGNRTADYWNQEFLPCWLNNFQPNGWAFLSNATGSFVEVPNYHSWTQLIADWPITFSDPNILNYVEFLVCTFDGNWIDVATQPFAPYPYNGDRAFRSSNGDLTSNSSALSGDNLFKMEPGVGNGTC